MSYRINITITGKFYAQLQTQKMLLHLLLFKMLFKNLRVKFIFLNKLISWFNENKGFLQSFDEMIIFFFYCFNLTSLIDIDQAIEVILGSLTEA